MSAVHARAEASALSPLSRFMLIVTVFVLIWPPVFGCVGGWAKIDFGAPVAGWIAAIVVYSYSVCILPAFLAGVVHAVAAIRFQQNSMLVPILTAAAAATVSVVLIVGIQPSPAQYQLPARIYAVFLLASLIASLICWRLTRRFARTS